jgi:ABC-2 type transport system permease protein
MIQIISYYKYNIKILAKDKIPLIWSVIVPSVFLYLNRQFVYTIKDLRFWWAYIIISSYIYGVGIYAMTMKESGTLKTLFSISNTPFLFFFGNLLTQITYCVICISVFNIVAILFFNYPLFIIFYYSIKIILLSIPIAFLGMVLTLFKKIHVNSLSSLTNIIMMIFFFSMNIDGPLQKLNPIRFYADIILLQTKIELIHYVITSLLFISFGVFCIAKFSVIPIDKR